MSGGQRGAPRQTFARLTGYLCYTLTDLSVSSPSTHTQTHSGLQSGELPAEVWGAQTPQRGQKQRGENITLDRKDVAYLENITGRCDELTHGQGPQLNLLLLPPLK